MDANLAREQEVPPAGGVGSIADVVATKLLAAWAANRRQTLMPHTINFRALASAEVELLIALVAFAMQATTSAAGLVDRQRAERALELVGGNVTEAAALAAELDVPQPVTIFDRVREAGLGAHGYACILLSVDRTVATTQPLLGFVASRLGLASDTAHALESRYRA